MSSVASWIDKSEPGRGDLEYKIVFISKCWEIKERKYFKIKSAYILFSIHGVSLNPYISYLETDTFEVENALI